MVSNASFFSLDILPAHCAIGCEAYGTDPVHPDYFRFQAEGADGTKSEWSGWFKYEGEPIQLYWRAFWSEGDSQ